MMKNSIQRENNNLCQSSNFSSVLMLLGEVLNRLTRLSIKQAAKFLVVSKYST